MTIPSNTDPVPPVPDRNGRIRFARAAAAFLLAEGAAWRFKAELTPLLLGGRTFEGRSIPAQAAILLGEIALFSILFFIVLWAAGRLVNGRLQGRTSALLVQGARGLAAGSVHVARRARAFVQGSVLAQGLLIAALALCLVFPDILFRGASLRLSDQWYGAAANLPSRVFYPQPANHPWMGSYSDSGGAIFQSDPMMEYMLHSVREGDSPYWNPYSAAGALGPETLIDNKFSFFNLLYILLGGGTQAYDLAFLFLAFWAAFFVYLLIRERLHLGWLAGAAAVIFYLLNGYFTANLGSNVTQNNLYLPVCLFTALAYFEKPTAWRISALILAFAAFFSCTFIPTTFTVLFGMAPVLAGWLLVQGGPSGFRSARLWKLIGGFILCLLASILLLAVLYFPILQNLRVSGTLDAYAERGFNPVTWLTIASLFTSTHFYESYTAAGLDLQANPLFNWNVIYVYHFGILALNFAACSLAFRKGKWTPLVILCAAIALLGLARIYGLPGISWLISHLPIIRVFSSQYWWPAATIPMLCLVAVGVENLQERQNGYVASFVLFAVLTLSLMFLALTLHFSEPRMQYKQIWTALSVVLAAAGALAAFISGRITDPRKRRLLVGALVLLMFLEMTGEAKANRYAANDFYRSPSADITFLQKNAGLYRTLTLGYVSVRAENGSAFKIQEATSINLGTPLRYMNYFHSAFFMDESQRLFYNYYPSLRSIWDTPELDPVNWQKIDLLGVKYILTPASFTNFRQSFIDQGLRPVFENGDVAIFENPDVLPRAFSVEMDRVPAAGNVDLPANAAALLQPEQITLYRNAEVRLEGSVERPSLLVLTDNWNADWKAEVNGKQVPILLVGGVFRGVQVEAGAFDVHMHYRPRSLSAALFTSLACLLLLLYLNLDARRINAGLERKLPGMVS